MTSLPPAFVDRTRHLLGGEWSDFEEALHSEPSVSIRLNDKRLPALAYAPVLWCNTGFYLPVRPLFTLDPLFHSGVYYVQEASSMFLEQIIRQYIDKKTIVLDLCAAPGGKSTHLANLLPQGSFVVANEVIRARASILAENVQKWGNAGIAVTSNTPEAIGKLTSFFDMVMVDAPCSGEGLWRKDPDAVKEWSPANVEMCAARQKDILKNVWNALKENGLLIYSTCTYNRKENEDNVCWIAQELGADIVSVNIDASWGVTCSNAGYRFYPHKTRGEGFFIAVLRKMPPLTPPKPPKEERNNKNHKQFIHSELLLFLQKGINWVIEEKEGNFRAYDERFAGIVRLLEQRLNVVSCGVELGVCKGADFIPHTALALSKNLDSSSCNTVEVDWQTAIRYLRRETVEIANQPIGYLLLTYRNIPVGWIKNIGQRSNNLYPPEWRIRMQIQSGMTEPKII